MVGQSTVKGEAGAALQLTKNQKKKRRQKLSKIGKQDPSTASDGSCMSDISVLSCTPARQLAVPSQQPNNSKQHSQTECEQSRSQTAPSADEQSAVAAVNVEHREPCETAELASSSCPAHVWLGIQDCSTQAACIAAALVSRSDAAASPTAEAPSLGSKRTRTVSEHGNYKRYYGYRLGGGPDPRLQVISPFTAAPLSTPASRR